jgi:toxin FitB
MIVPDTSVLVPALTSMHPQHLAMARAIDGLTAVPAHCLVETYSVLTRLPSPYTVAASVAAAALANRFTALLQLPDDAALRIPAELSSVGVFAGATYDGLIAMIVMHHDAELLTRDRRAVATYAACGVRFTMAN